MLNRALLTLAITSAISTTASADIVGVQLSLGAWEPTFEGDVQDGLVAVNLENDLGLDDKRATTASLAIEHPVPGLPNVRLDYADLSIDATNTLNRNFDFDGVNFSVSEDVSTQADLTHIDGVFYYELLDNWVSLDLGIGVRLFDGSIQIQSLTESAQEELEDPLPLIYGAVKFDLPFSGLAFAADVKGVSYDGDAAYDYTAKVMYITTVGLGVEAGYRGFVLDIEELSDFTADIDISGPYAGVVYKF